MSIAITYFIPPNGEKRQGELSRIHAEDEAWFKANGAKLSAEELPGGDIVVYADIGIVTDDGEPDEVIEISGGRDCYATMAALRKQCEAAFSGAVS